MDKDLI